MNSGSGRDRGILVRGLGLELDATVRPNSPRVPFGMKSIIAITINRRLNETIYQVYIQQVTTPYTKTQDTYTQRQTGYQESQPNI